MYKLETVNNSNFKIIDEFNITNEYKEELIEICTNKNIFKKLLLGKNIKFIKSGKEYIGFMWFTKLQHQSYKIHCMKIMPKFHTKVYYEEIFKLFSSNSSVFIGDNNNLNEEALVQLGFRIIKTIVEMELLLENSTSKSLSEDENISFRVFINGIDEKTRCFIQNKVFNALNRQSINEDDIEYEKYQKHYISQGCIFISLHGIDIGYGQLIKKDSRIYIANFGILPGYRGKGYGKQLLNHLLAISRNYNAESIYLRCDKENRDALKLYDSIGFKEIDSYCEFQRF